MYARVARFEGAEGQALRDSAERMKSQTGPPPGVPGKGFLLLIDPDNGRSLAIGFFDTEEDLRTGDAALNAMNPDLSEGDGKRISVESYEVAIDVKI